MVRLGRFIGTCELLSQEQPEEQEKPQKEKLALVLYTDECVLPLILKRQLLVLLPQGQRWSFTDTLSHLQKYHAAVPHIRCLSNLPRTLVPFTIGALNINETAISILALSDALEWIA